MIDLQQRQETIDRLYSAYTRMSELKSILTFAENRAMTIAEVGIAGERGTVAKRSSGELQAWDDISNVLRHTKNLASAIQDQIEEVEDSLRDCLTKFGGACE